MFSLFVDPRQHVSVKPIPPGSNKPAVSGKSFCLISPKNTFIRLVTPNNIGTLQTTSSPMPVHVGPNRLASAYFY